jgi:uncharacterized membrane protein YhaH (DUF805 family)
MWPRRSAIGGKRHETDEGDKPMKWVLMPFTRMTDFAGRSRRTEFWLFWLAALVLQMLTSYIDATTAQTVIFGGMGPFTLIMTLILLTPAATVGVRRLHDIGRSGWWMLLFGLPYAGWLAGVEAGSQNVIAAIALLLGSVVLLVLLVQPGTPGENAFGPDPKAGIAEPQTSL